MSVRTQIERINGEVSEQAALLAQLDAAVDALPDAGSGGGLDLSEFVKYDVCLMGEFSFASTPSSGYMITPDNPNTYPRLYALYTMQAVNGISYPMISSFYLNTMPDPSTLSSDGIITQFFTHGGSSGTSISGLCASYAYGYGSSYAYPVDDSHARTQLVERFGDGTLMLKNTYTATSSGSKVTFAVGVVYKYLLLCEVIE